MVGNDCVQCVVGVMKDDMYCMIKARMVRKERVYIRVGFRMVGENNVYSLIVW